MSAEADSAQPAGAWEPGPRFFAPDDIEVLDDGGARVRLIVDGERCYFRVELSVAFPLTCPGQLIGFRDASGKQIGILADLADVDAATRAMLEEKLARIYFVPVIRAIHTLREEFGTLNWHVETDQGTARLMTRGRRDHVHAIGTGPMGAPSDNSLLITDVDGNRYRIPDVGALDARSRFLLMEKVL